MHACYEMILNVISVNGNPKPMEAEDVVQIRKELRSIRKQVDYMLDRLDSGFASSPTGVNQIANEGKVFKSFRPSKQIRSFVRYFLPN